MRIDAGGKQCPIPVIMAKKELEAGEQDVEIIVDGPTQVGNLERLGDALGRKATSEPFGDKFLVKFANGETIKGASVAEADTYAVFFNTNAIGTNESELGGNLAKMAIFTLSESERVPSYVLFMNEGVKLPAGDEPQIVLCLIPSCIPVYRLKYANAGKCGRNYTTTGMVRLFCI